MSEIPKDAVIRRDHMIIHPDGRQEDCKFINRAKKRSTELQKTGTQVRVLRSTPKEWNPHPTKRHFQRAVARVTAVFKKKPKLTDAEIAAAARRFAGSVEHVSGD